MTAHLGECIKTHGFWTAYFTSGVSSLYPILIFPLFHLDFELGSLI